MDFQVKEEERHRMLFIYCQIAFVIESPRRKTFLGSMFLRHVMDFRAKTFAE
jgi:hypothetical protein